MRKKIKLTEEDVSAINEDILQKNITINTLELQLIQVKAERAKKKKYLKRHCRHLKLIAYKASCGICNHCGLRTYDLTKLDLAGYTIDKIEEWGTIYKKI